MIRKLVILIIFIVISGLLWFATSLFENHYLTNTAYSFTALAVIYLVFKLILEEVVTRKINDPGSRYSFRRAVSILNIVAFIIAGIAIWVENVQTLLVSYGLIAAGVAVALQDFFKNIVGGVILFSTGLYRVGDRIEMNEKYGDVIDIGLMYTTLFEIEEWIAGDQPTGRLVASPNGDVLSKTVHNYTKDHGFIWDEIKITITYESDWQNAARTILDTAEKETAEATEKARLSLINLSDKYFLPARAEVPALYLTLTDNWIEMNVRYVTGVRQRRVMRDRISRIILENILKSPDIKIASQTMELTVKDFQGKER